MLRIMNFAPRQLRQFGLQLPTMFESVGIYCTGNNTRNPVHLPSPNPYPTCVLTNPNFPVPCIPTQWSLCSTECNSSSDKADQSLLNPLHSSPFTTVKYLLPLGCFLNGFVPINFPAKSIPPSRAKSALLHAQQNPVGFDDKQQRQQLVWGTLRRFSTLLHGQ